MFAKMTEAQLRCVRQYVEKVLDRHGLCRVAEEMGINYQALRKWARSGRFPAERVVQFLGIVTALEAMPVAMVKLKRP
jgi:hypothetical protein